MSKLIRECEPGESQRFLAELQAKLEKRAGGTPNPAPAIPLVQAPAGDEAGSEWDEVARLKDEMVRLKMEADEARMEPDEARRELPHTADQVYHGVRGEYPLREAQHANDKRAHELILAAVREDDASRKRMNRCLTVGPFQFYDSSYRDQISVGAYLLIAPSYRLFLFLDNWGWKFALQRRHRISGHFMTARHYGLNRFLSISRDWKNSASRLA